MVNNDKIDKALRKILKDYYVNSLGYDSNEVDTLGLYNVVIKTNELEEYTDVYVYAEMNLEEFYTIEHQLNSVVTKYDNGSYFEANSPGIFMARIWWDAESNLNSEDSSDTIKSGIIDLIDFFTLHCDELDDFTVKDYSYSNNVLTLILESSHYSDLEVKIKIPEDEFNYTNYLDFVNKWAPRLLDKAERAMSQY